VFGGITFWALRPSNRTRFESDAHIPLNDER
jgi:cbb3-type cytochrome oxidase subunit 3